MSTDAGIEKIPLSTLLAELLLEIARHCCFAVEKGKISYRRLRSLNARWPVTVVG